MNLQTFGPIDLVNLWLHHKLMDGWRKEKAKFAKQVDQFNTVVTSYQKLNADLVDRRTELQLQIRLLTRGTPVTEPMTVADVNKIGLENDAFAGLSEQQRIAHYEVVQRAYRKCVTLCHPDHGGSKEDFDELQSAYKARDIQRITDLYILLSKQRNLYWQASADGVDYASTQLGRVNLQVMGLRNTPAFRVMQMHIFGRFAEASMLMRKVLADQCMSLEMELHNLRNQNHGQSSESRSEVEIEVQRRTEEKSEGDTNHQGQEIQGRGRAEIQRESQGSSDQGQEGYVAAGKGAAGPSERDVEEIEVQEKGSADVQGT